MGVETVDNGKKNCSDSLNFDSDSGSESESGTSDDGTDEDTLIYNERYLDLSMKKKSLSGNEIVKDNEKIDVIIVLFSNFTKQMITIIQYTIYIVCSTCVSVICCIQSNLQML